jgi:CO dehydrogenase nickel-insertion accessory protein CooC1
MFGRGGSGKSTCTVLLAQALAKAGYNTCVLDADSTNEGLAEALGADHAPNSLLDWLGGHRLQRRSGNLSGGQCLEDSYRQARTLGARCMCSYRQARTRGALYVLNKVADAETEYELWQRLLSAGLQATASIPDDPQIRHAWLVGRPINSVAGLAEASKIVRALEEGRGAFVEPGAVASVVEARAARGEPALQPRR